MARERRRHSSANHSDRSSSSDYAGTKKRIHRGSPESDSARAVGSALYASKDDRKARDRRHVIGHRGRNDLSPSNSHESRKESRPSGCGSKEEELRRRIEKRERERLRREDDRSHGIDRGKEVHRERDGRRECGASDGRGDEDEQKYSGRSRDSNRSNGRSGNGEKKLGDHKRADERDQKRYGLEIRKRSKSPRNDPNIKKEPVDSHEHSSLRTHLKKPRKEVRSRGGSQDRTETKDWRASSHFGSSRRKQFTHRASPRLDSTSGWGKPVKEEMQPVVEKEKPNFQPSGKLAEDTNTFRGVVIKYNEPPDARKPKLRWRLYPFKNDEALPVLYVHRQSAYLIGRDHLVADIPVDHPSCSKQHAALQYRLTSMDLDDGTTIKKIRPYIIDLNSANGTYLNGDRIEPQRYYELREKDMLKFGFSSREYIVLHENSANNGPDDLVDEQEIKKSPSSSPG